MPWLVLQPWLSRGPKPALGHHFDELEEEGSQHDDGRDRDTDGCIEGVGSDCPPTVGVEKETTKGLALEEGLLLCRQLSGSLGLAIAAALTSA